MDVMARFIYENIIPVSNELFIIVLYDVLWFGFYYQVIICWRPNYNIDYMCWSLRVRVGYVIMYFIYFIYKIKCKFLFEYWFKVLFFGLRF